MEKSASKGSFFPKVILKVCVFLFLCSVKWFIHQKKRIFSNLISLAHCDRITIRPWKKNREHLLITIDFTILLCIKSDSKKLLLMPLTFFFKSDGEKTIFHHRNHVKSGFACFITCKKNLKSKFRSMFVIFLSLGSVSLLFQIHTD